MITIKPVILNADFPAQLSTNVASRLSGSTVICTSVGKTDVSGHDTHRVLYKHYHCSRPMRPVRHQWFPKHFEHRHNPRDLFLHFKITCNLCIYNYSSGSYFSSFTEECAIRNYCRCNYRLFFWYYRSKPSGLIYNSRMGTAFMPGAMVKLAHIQNHWWSVME